VTETSKLLSLFPSIRPRKEKIVLCLRRQRRQSKSVHGPCSGIASAHSPEEEEEEEKEEEEEEGEEEELLTSAAP
jgi:hypothetical protein